MKFWSAAEASPEIIDDLRSLRNSIQDSINELLLKTKISEVWTGWQWSFIAIVISPKLGVEYTERVQRLKKQKVLEFRLCIDFSQFLSGNLQERRVLFFEQLHRCISLMAKWDMEESDREILHKVLKDAAALQSIN